MVVEGTVGGMMGGLFLLYLMGGRGGDRRTNDDAMIRFLALLFVPLVIAATAPCLWWVASRDAGHDRVSSGITALGPVVLAAAGWLMAGWWAVPLVLFLDGLVGLYLVSWTNRTDHLREQRERAREEADYQTIS
jgi:hypothetical protein